MKFPKKNLELKSVGVEISSLNTESPRKTYLTHEMGENGSKN